MRLADFCSHMCNINERRFVCVITQYCYPSVKAVLKLPENRPTQSLLLECLLLPHLHNVCVASSSKQVDNDWWRSRLALKVQRELRRLLPTGDARCPQTVSSHNAHVTESSAVHACLSRPRAKSVGRPKLPAARLFRYGLSMYLRETRCPVLRFCLRRICLFLPKEQRRDIHRVVCRTFRVAAR